MKTLFVYLLRFCVLFIWIILDACHPKPTDTVDPDTNRSPTYYKSFLLKNSSPLGLAIIDTLQREMALAYGDKNTQGKLVTINQIAYWRKDKDVIFLYKFDDDHLPSEITAITNKTNAQITFNKYDLINGSVNVTLTDLTLSQEKISNKSFPLDASTITKLKYLQNTGQIIKSKGRLAAGVNEECNELSSYAKIALSVSSCVFAAIDLAGVGGAVAIALGAETFGLSFGILLLSEIGTISACYDAVKDIEGGLKGECDDESDLPKNLLDCATGFITNVAKIKLKQEVDIVTDCFGLLLQTLRKLYTEAGANTKTSSPSSTGGAFGDPHLQTFDGLYYDFQGYGEFVAVKSLTDNFEIQVRQAEIAPYLNRQVTMHTGIAINTGNDKVCLYPNGIYINSRGYNIGDGFVQLTKGSVSTSNGLITIVSDNEDVIKISTQTFSLGFIDYKITLNSNRKGKVQGLLGNFDGSANNDTKLQAGGTVNPATFSDLYPTYAESWRISQDKSLFVYSNGASTATYTKKDFPKSQTELDAAARLQAETICRQKGVTDEPYLSACIMDVALSGSDRYAVSAIGAQESKLLINNFTINKFTSFEAADITPYGTAEIADGLLYLTRADYWKSAAVFKKYKADITNGFETTFDFSMSDMGGIRDARSRVGADGIVFVLQDYGSSNIPLSGGVGLGYNGLPRSLVIEFDTYNNGSYENQDDISLNTQGINPNSVDDSRTTIKAKTRPMPVMNDGKIHNVVIRYTKKSEGLYKLYVFFDKDASPYLTADNINIQQTIGAYGTGVFVGLTAATGDSYESHIIYNWSFKPL